MKKIITKVASLALVTALISSSTVFAASSAFNNKKVDSNELTFITSCTKKTEYNEVYVKITQIYKADGSKSDYKKVKAKFTSGGSVCTTSSSYTANKGSECTATLKDAYRKKGKTTTFYSMGNNPSLDCKIDGKLVVV